jgi:hypothetical protein
MILFSTYKGTIAYLVPLPFVALGECEICNGSVLLLGINMGKWILTMQLHFEKKN